MNKDFYYIENIENRFKEVTLLPHNLDISTFPITEHIGFEVRLKEKKENGEVFTPLEIVDKMIMGSDVKSNAYNMDLCAGHGQFTIRMLRKFYNDNPHFDIKEYLTQWHWFNEFNPVSSKELIYIFGKNINLLIGPAQELKKMQSDQNDIWFKGIYQWKNGYWTPIKDISDIVLQHQNITTVKKTSKALF